MTNARPCSSQGQARISCFTRQVLRITHQAPGVNRILARAGRAQWGRTPSGPPPPSREEASRDRSYAAAAPLSGISPALCSRLGLWATRKRQRTAALQDAGATSGAAGSPEASRSAVPARRGRFIVPPGWSRRFCRVPSCRAGMVVASRWAPPMATPGTDVGITGPGRIMRA